MPSPAFRVCQTRTCELISRATTAQRCPRDSRLISTNSAIARGLRESEDAERRRYPAGNQPIFHGQLPRIRERPDQYAERKPVFSTRKATIRKIPHGMRVEPRRDDKPESYKEYAGAEDTGPISVPHTIASSKFIYGNSAVRAALAARRRKCFKLYVHDRALRRESTPNNLRRPRATHEDEPAEISAGSLISLAKTHPKLEVKMVDDSFLPVMDQMSEGRPHNGVILDASPLPTIPVRELRPAQRNRPRFFFEPDRQTPEQAELNGGTKSLPYNSHGWRYPFVLFLDGIVDEGNVGAIIRSAYYLGVDAVVMTTRGTAPIEAVALKASSGAAEAMPILTVANPLGFLARTSLHGWRVYAADAPPPPSDNFNVTSGHVPRALDPGNTSPTLSYTRPNSLAVLPDGHHPLLEHPTILMLGGERLGFRASIRAKANYLVGIRGVRGLDIGLDSLNVSVASALIMLELLRKPAEAEDTVLKRKHMEQWTIEQEIRDMENSKSGHPDEFDKKNDELLF